MAEGGLLSWKRQKIIQYGPVADYSMLRHALPPPPEGKIWYKNQVTKEWRLIDDNQFKKESSMQATGKERDYKENDFEAKLSSLKAVDTGEHDFFEHVILPSDTFQGICLTYRISATRLRQVNMFSGTNLKLAPEKLIIPVKKTLVNAGKVRMQDKDSAEFKIHSFKAIFPSMGISEVKYYLDIAEYDIEKALNEARNDIKWEKESRGSVLTNNDFDDTLILNNESSVTLTVDEAVPVVDKKFNLFKMNKGKKEKINIEMTSLLKKM